MSSVPDPNAPPAAHAAMKAGMKAGHAPIRIDGALIVANHHRFRQRVADLLHAAPADARHLVVDLSRCGYIDAAGLGALVSATKAADSVGGSLMIEGASEDLRTLFEITRLDTVLRLQDA